MVSPRLKHQPRRRYTYFFYIVTYWYCAGGRRHRRIAKDSIGRFVDVFFQRSSNFQHIRCRMPIAFASVHGSSTCDPDFAGDSVRVLPL